MGDPQQDRPNEAAPVSVQQLREALGFITEQYNNVVDGGKNVFVWLWEALQGDFNQQRSTGQVVFDTVVSMIPGVDQVCDVRDIIANCKQIDEDKSNALELPGNTQMIQKIKTTLIDPVQATACRKRALAPRTEASSAPNDTSS